MLFLCVLAGAAVARAAVPTSVERAALEAQLAQVQKEQAQAAADLATAQSKSSSLKNDIAVLNAKIKKKQLDIQAKNLMIQTLGGTIDDTQAAIDSLSDRIEVNKKYLTDLFQQIDQAEGTPVVTIVLTNTTLSGMFDDAVQMQALQRSILGFAQQLAADKASSTAAKADLEAQQNAAVDARYAVQQDQKTLQSNQSQQQELLSVSKNKEKSYATLLEAKKKEAEQISARLFALAGGSNPIPFGTAYKYALTAQKSTGIDPAFLLAIMTQESNLGSNQGTCYLTDPATGAGVSVRSGKTFPNVMKPTRDVEPFMNLTRSLGLDPMHMVVSCPQEVGWGGAMGPAQFIASTWMLFTNRIASALGLAGYANPWNPEHAFMASAMYLTDLGAAGGGYTAESNAACRYYSGKPCSASTLVAGYGNSVMNLASQIQTTEIDKLQGL